MEWLKEHSDVEIEGMPIHEHIFGEKRKTVKAYAESMMKTGPDGFFVEWGGFNEVKAHAELFEANARPRRP